MPTCGKCHRDAPEGALFCSFCGESIKPVTSPGQEVDPLIGQTVGGKYFIHQLLGHGGMGDVYKATHLTLDRPVVLKLLKKLFHSDPSLVQRFHREARAASRLNHPNSITIIDFGQTEDGTLFMAMEYLAGRSLERVIAEDGPLQEPRVVHIGAQILAALAEAHVLGIIHRDLKPANVMIEPRRDEPDFVKVLDFGIAKLNEPGGGGGITQAGIVCGTPGYMSTEQVRGEELDARSDLYGVGVILFEMLTGVLPFDADTPMGLVTKHLVEDPPVPAVRRPGVMVSHALEAVIMRGLARDRRDRFASADDMRAALLSCAAAAPSSIRPTPPPSSTMIFDPAGLPPGPGARPVTGPQAAAGRPPSSSAIEFQVSQAVQARATAAFPDVSDVAGTPPAQGTPAPGQKTPPPAQKTPAPAPRTPAPAQAQPRVARTPAAKKRTPPPPRPAVRREMDEATPGRGRGGNKTPMFMAAGVAALAVVGVVAWLAVREPAEVPPVAQPSAAPQPLPPPPVAPPVEPAAQPSPPPEKVATPEPVQPEETVQPKPPPPEPKPVAKRVAVAPRVTKGIRTIGRELNSIPTPPRSSGDGVLTVVATPWAMVAIDGRDIGETPREVRLGAGSYRVRATHPALGQREETVTIRPGRRRVWNPTFAR